MASNNDIVLVEALTETSPAEKRNHPAVGEQFQPPDTDLGTSSSSWFSAISLSSSSSSSRVSLGAPRPPTTPAVDPTTLVLSFMGAILGVAIATGVALKIGRRRRSSSSSSNHRHNYNNKYNDRRSSVRTQNMNKDDFEDEDDDYSSDDRNGYTIPVFSDNINNKHEPDDWLTRIGFDDDDDSIDFDVEYGSSGNEGENKDNNEDDNLDSFVNGGDSSSIFENTISSRWITTTTTKTKTETAALPNAHECNNEYEELKKELQQLNETLFYLNNELVQQQGELVISARTVKQKRTRRKHRNSYQHHKKILGGIAVLETEKDDATQKLKLVQDELNFHRLERRRQLFLQ